MTKLLPNVNATSAPYFCKNVDGSPYTFEVDGVTTGFLRLGQQLSLLGVSFDEKSMSSGLIDQTDSVDPDVRLSRLAIGKPDGTVVGVIEIPATTPTASMTYSVQGNSRRMTLNFDSKGLTFEGRKINVTLVGSLTLDTSALEVHAVHPAVGDDLAVIGYFLDAQRVNYNRRRVAV